MRRNRNPPPGEDEAEIVADGSEDDVGGIVGRLTVIAARVRLHDARVHRKPLALDETHSPSPTR